MLSLVARSADSRSSAHLDAALDSHPVCDVITVDSEAEFGSLIRLCADYAQHVARHLAIDDPEHAPVPEVLRAFAPALVAIVESNYFDLDYRSEFSATHETSFSVRDPSAKRIHFFGSCDDAECNDELDSLHMRDVAVKLANHYRGYVVIRPQRPGAVGRSIITPEGSHDFLARPATLSAHIRTAVPEHVTLFGVPLCARGIPFMEQDGHLLRCVHVSVWMCHYTATLRGIAPRRATAQFHLAEDETGAYGRQYPSEGLSAPTLSRVLRKLDLPPEIVDDADLVQHRDLEWYDRQELWDSVSQIEEGSDDWKRLWIAENLTATICRYLNSGFSCILSRDDLEHTQVVCGYVREEDVNKEKVDLPTLSSGQALHSDVVALLVADDQRGPFEIVEVAELVDLIMNEDPTPAWTSLAVITPLPRGLWLSGNKAERRGAQILAECARRRLESLDAWTKMLQLTSDEIQAHRKVLTQLVAWTTVPEGGNLAIRCYAAAGSDFKRGFAHRVDDGPAARVSGYTPLPKYVWVVEAMDREERSKEAPMVRATVVLDGSEVSDDDTAIDNLRTLLVHIPGQISTIRKPVFDDDHWRPTTLKPYYSGRWHHDRDWLLSAESTAARWKGASAPLGR